MFRQELCTNVSAPLELSLQTASLSFLFSLVTIPGNLLVILAVVIDPNKNLRNPFNWFVANLAVADLIVGGITEPCSVFNHINESPGRKRPSAVLHVSFFISVTASVLSLGALTWDRYVAITSPLEYRVKLSSARAAVISACIWLISCIVPPFIYTNVGYVRYSFVFENTAVVLTFLILLFTYIRIFQRFRCQVQEWEQMHDGTEENQAQRRLVCWEAKVTKTLVIMLALFLMCYLPALVLAYLMNFCHSCSCLTVHWFRDWHFLLVIFSSGLNPFIYGYRLEPYRSAVKALSKCHKRRQEQTFKNVLDETSASASSQADLVAKT